jgi:hypothetical protein
MYFITQEIEVKKTVQRRKARLNAGIAFFSSLKYREARSPAMGTEMIPEIKPIPSKPYFVFILRIKRFILENFFPGFVLRFARYLNSTSPKLKKQRNPIHAETKTVMIVPIHE